MAPPKRSELARKYQIETWRDLTPLNASVGSMLHNMTGTWRFIRPFYEDKIPACQNACPLGNDIEGWIKHLQTGDYRKAYWHLKREQPFPAILGRVCFHFCEKACNRNSLDHQVGIRQLERFLGDHGPLTAPPPDLPDYHQKSLAVIGSGPAGLSAAYFSRRLGFHVTVFESAPDFGGLLRYGIPAYRLPRKILAAEIEGLKNMGLVMRTGVTVGKDVTVSELRQDFDFIFLGTGMPVSRKMGLAGENQSPKIMNGLAVLKKIAMGLSVDLGKKVIVIGGGNTAIDTARSAVRLGAEVEVVYRRTEREMPAHPEEVAEAVQEGVRFTFLAAPEHIELASDGTINELLLAEMELGPPDESGRRRPLRREGAHTARHPDTLLMAIGEEPDLAFLNQVVQTDSEVVLVQAGMEARAIDNGGAKIFAGGDITGPPRTVVHSLAAGKRAAIGMDIHRQGLDIWEVLPGITIGAGPALSFSKYSGWENINPVPQNLAKVVDGSMMVYDYFQPQEPVALRITRPEERKKSFEAYVQPFRDSEALDEAGRCLHCGRCVECDNCLIFCPDVSILVNDDRQFGYSLDYDYCKGCGICQAECPRAAITMIDENIPL